MQRARHTRSSTAICMEVGVGVGVVQGPGQVLLLQACVSFVLSEGRSTTVFVASVVQSWSVESIV